MEASNSALVSHLINAGYLKTGRIIRAFERTDRRLFVPKEFEMHAYIDEPLPIGGGQTISAPHMAAIMTELLKPRRTDTVFEVGTGSGYQAAVLSGLVKKVYTAEVDRKLASFAARNLKKAEIKNVDIFLKDGSEGLEYYAPYGKIIVTCAMPEMPRAMISQLARKSILVAPVGTGRIQELVRAIKSGDRLETEHHGACAFVPLRSAGPV